MKKRIVAVTGCRSEYDILYSVLKALDYDDFFELSIIVTGAHLSEFFGHTIKEIENDGFTIAGKVHNLINNDDTIGKAKSAGLLLSGLSELLYMCKPDYVLVAADREESIVTALSCTYLQIPVIHIAGGDRTFSGPESGDVDEQVRHATTKLANIHFTLAKEHKDRIINLGEEAWRVFFSGNPALDRFRAAPSRTKKEIVDYLGFQDTDKPLILMIQHVISGDHVLGAQQIKTTLSALSQIDANCVINYPNSDNGSQKMIDIIEQYNKLPNFVISKNLPREYFISLVRNIDVLVGNSSMAYVEGCFLHLPAIDIGNRQRQRMHGGNVVNLGYDKDEIQKMVHKILTDTQFKSQLQNCRQIYGDGTAAQKIVHFIKNIKRSKEEILAKDITF